ncbi:GAF domain-containing sensor histidine kinase [Marinoscillum furvescens]|uniref:histidine kinase n=1 Tax=Marinoscillum furvescens DSM 4134 TaxID=1122208 RepID=A0A3D9KZ66_MARFU|nr:GAF domain-containing sensor histidine kinase [Marinoscillum furvescens]RED95582.1 GAF domain-containing protein [Marinoscillum furvescens DSM 4134]
MFDLVKNHASQYVLLTQISTKILEVNSLEELRKIIPSSIKYLLDFDRFVMIVKVPDEDKYEMYPLFDHRTIVQGTDKLLAPKELTELNGPALHCLTCKAPFVYNDDQFTKEEVTDPLLENKLFNSYLYCPLKYKNTFPGVLAFAHRKPDMYEHTDVELATILASWLGISVNRWQVQQQKEQLNLQLKETNQALVTFSHAASHDLKSPINSVMSLLNLVENNLVSGAEREETMKHMRSTLNRMALLIDKLLQYALSGRSDEFSNVNLNTLMQEIKSDLHDSITTSNAEINYEDLPVIKGVEIELRVMFQNLISNAIKYQPTGNTPVINIRHKNMAEHHILLVSDNGIGIPEKHLKAIFTEFTRVKTNNQYDGAGIGLASCLRIAKGHGGSIRAESEPGKGTTMIITLAKDPAPPDSIL